MIKMVAIDLDGTLLDDDKNYDQQRFEKLVEKAQDTNRHIVIATGNQHVKAVQFFENIKDKIIFVTDNGSTIHIDDSLYYSKTLEVSEYQEFINKLPDPLQDRMVVSTHGYAIISDGEHAASFMEAANKHYPILKRENNLNTLDIPIVKVTLKFDEGENVDIEEIQAILPEDWRVTSSGFGFYDIIAKRISKLTAVEQLQKLYNIHSDEVAAFGDSNNDLELLEGITHSYAMENGTDKVKNASRYLIGNNNENAVIDTLEDIFN